MDIREHTLDFQQEMDHEGDSNEEQVDYFDPATEQYFDLVDDDSGEDDEASDYEDSEINNLDSQLHALSVQFQNDEIDFKTFNKTLVIIEKDRISAKEKLLDLQSNQKVSKKLKEKTDKIVKDIEALMDFQILGPNIINKTIDQAFQAASKQLEKVEFKPFTSSMISSEMSNIFEIPVPELYTQELEHYQELIRKTNMGPDQLKGYINLLEKITIAKTNDFKNDILYSQFVFDIKVLFFNLRSSIRQKQLNKEPLDILSIYSGLNDNLTVLIESYGDREERLFEGSEIESDYVRKFMKDLREIAEYDEVTGEYEKKFTSQEIKEDFLTGDPQELNNKYGEYVPKYIPTATGIFINEENSSFDSSTGKITLRAKDHSKWFKRISAPVKYKFVGKTAVNTRWGNIIPKTKSNSPESLEDKIINTFNEFEELEGIMGSMDKDVLLSCIETKNQFTPRSKLVKYIDELYKNSIPIYSHTQNPESISEYAQSVEKMTDEFHINKQLLKYEWEKGVVYTPGDKVLIDRNNWKKEKLAKQLENTEKKLSDLNKIRSNNQELENEVRKLTSALGALEKGMIRAPHYTGTLVSIKNQTAKVLLTMTNKIMTVDLVYISRQNIPKPDVPTGVGIVTLRPQTLKDITTWIKKVLDLTSKDLSPVIDESVIKSQRINNYLKNSKKKVEALYKEAYEKYDKHTKSKGLKSSIKKWGPIPDTGPLKYEYADLPDGFVDEIMFKNIFTSDSDALGYDPLDSVQYFSDLKKDKESNPFMTMSTVIPNKLKSRIRTGVYSGLVKAIKNTDTNSYFRLSHGDATMDFYNMVFKHISDSEIKRYYFLFVEHFFEHGATVVPGFGMQKIEYMRQRLGVYFFGKEFFIYSPDKFGKLMPLVKDEGNPRYIPGKTRAIEYIIDSETEEKTAASKYLRSITWGIDINPTFQVLPFESNYEDSFVVITPTQNYRIRLANPNGKFYTGWLVSGLYKYPFIVTDFKEYLSLLRTKYVNQYNSFRELSIVKNIKIEQTDIFIRRIEMITEHLGDNFSIEDIKKKRDQEMEIRLSEREKILNALKELSDINHHILEKLAEELETTTKDLSESKNYINKIDQVILNLYSRNNSVLDLIDGNLLVLDIVSLTSNTIKTDILSFKELLEYEPEFKALSDAKATNKDAFEKMMNVFSTSAIVNVGIINVYEEKTKLQLIEKKYILIDLINLRTWGDAIDKVKDRLSKVYFNGKPFDIQKVDNMITPDTEKVSKRLKAFLHSKKNQIQNTKNFKNRKESIKKLYNKFKKSSNNDQILNLATGIESACYSLTNKQTNYTTLINLVYRSQLPSDIQNTPVDLVKYVSRIHLDKEQLNDRSWNDIINNNSVNMLKAIQSVANSTNWGIWGIDKLYSKKYKQLTPGVKEYYNTKDDAGMIKWHSIEKTVQIPTEEKRKKLIDILLEKDYEPRIQVFKAELQKSIDDKEAKDRIKNLRGLQGANSKEIEDSMKSIDTIKLNKMPYEDLLEIRNNIYVSPKFMSRIPSSLAHRGVSVFPLKKRGLLLVGGTFPTDPRAYRFRNSKGELYTKLTEICKWAGTPFPEISYPKNTTIYFKNIFSFESRMYECVKNIQRDSFNLKLNKGVAIHPSMIDSICKKLGINEMRAHQYFMKYGGDKARFPLGGTKEEYTAFVNKSLHDECLGIILEEVPEFQMPTTGLPKKKKTPIDNQIYWEISTLNGIKRKIYDSKNGSYPVPIDYDCNNFPIYGHGHKQELAFMIKNGIISPWFVDKIKIVPFKNTILVQKKRTRAQDKLRHELKKVEKEILKLRADVSSAVSRLSRKPEKTRRIVRRSYDVKAKNKIDKLINKRKSIINKLGQDENFEQSEPFDDIRFEPIDGAGLPFIIDESSSSSMVSKYYVEQMFRDSRYGMPIVTRIGIVPKRINQEKLKNATGFSLVKKIKQPIESLVTNKEHLRIKYFQSTMDTMTEVERFGDENIITTDMIKSKGAYALLDSRETVLKQGLKYDPPSVWEWNPKKDKKSKAEMDTKVWEAYKQTKIVFIKHWLQKAGSSSSALIAAKDLATKELEIFRMNMPSQKLRISGIKIEKDKPSDKPSVDWMTKITSEKLISNPEYQAKMKMKAWELSANVAKDNKRFYTEKLLAFGLVTIDKDIIKYIKDPRKLFKNYNRSKTILVKDMKYDIIGQTDPRPLRTVDNQWKCASVPLYTKDSPLPDILDTVTEILYNMSWTSEIQVPEPIRKYYENPSIIKDLSDEEADEVEKLADKYPLLDIFIDIAYDVEEDPTREPKLWNILTRIIDKWYTFSEKEDIQDKYVFRNTTVNIEMFDLVSYLGDSYMQNYDYTYGITTVIKKVQGKDPLYVGMTLEPGCKYEEYTSSDLINVGNFKNNSEYSVSVGENLKNPYLTVYKIPGSQDFINKTFIVGSELHKRNSITTNIARRSALYNEININQIRPCFGMANVTTEVRKSRNAVDKIDIDMYLKKGGRQFTLYEMSDKELNEKSIARFKIEIAKKEAKQYIRIYKNALLELVKPDKTDKFQEVFEELAQKTFPLIAKDVFTEAIQVENSTNRNIKKRPKKYKMDTPINAGLEPMVLTGLMDKVRRVPKERRKRYINDLVIPINFLDPEWPKKNLELQTNFSNIVGEPMDSFLYNQKRELLIDIEITGEEITRKQASMIVNRFLKTNLEKDIINFAIPARAQRRARLRSKKK
jgi:hypothetical protein